MKNLIQLVQENKEKLYKTTVLVLLCFILSIMIFQKKITEEDIQKLWNGAIKVGEIFHTKDNASITANPNT